MKTRTAQAFHSSIYSSITPLKTDRANPDPQGRRQKPALGLGSPRQRGHDYYSSIASPCKGRGVESWSRTP